jgi:hypothetical protein
MKARIFETTVCLLGLAGCQTIVVCPQDGSGCFAGGPT